MIDQNDGNKATQSQRLDIPYIEAYNQIDSHMRTCLKQPVGVGFSKLVGMFCTQYPWIAYDKPLRALANLRNLIDHTMTDHDRPFFLPAPRAVEEIEVIRDKMLHPETVLPRFRRDVVCMEAVDDMKAALAMVDTYDFSQFPVYRDQEYVGLLTENGITRCLAKRVHSRESLVNLPQTTVQDVLGWEERREDYTFVAADHTLEQLAYGFVQNQALEAILITQDGKPSRQLLGIVTRFDIMRLN